MIETTLLACGKTCSGKNFTIQQFFILHVQKSIVGCVTDSSDNDNDNNNNYYYYY